MLAQALSECARLYATVDGDRLKGSNRFRRDHTRALRSEPREELFQQRLRGARRHMPIVADRRGKTQKKCSARALSTRAANRPTGDWLLA